MLHPCGAKLRTDDAFAFKIGFGKCSPPGGTHKPTLWRAFSQQKLKRRILGERLRKLGGDDGAVLLEKNEIFASSLADRILPTLTECANLGESLPKACADKSAQLFLGTLHRSPPSAALVQKFSTAMVAEALVVRSGRLGVQFGIELALQSPHFVYRSEVGQATAGQDATFRKLTDFEVAQALSFTLTGEPPDAPLRALASQGALQNADVVKREALRLLQSEKAKDKVWDFTQKWLGLTEPQSIIKDTAKYPSFRTTQVQTAYADSRAYAVEALYDPNGGGLKRLLGGRPEDRRPGLANMEAFLISHSKDNATDPMHTASVVLRNLACMPLPPPPPGALVQGFDADPSKSFRQNFETRTSSAQCAACHVSLNGVGFAFEKYDPLGAVRTQLDGFPIDSKGSARLVDGKVHSFSGPEELMQIIAVQENAVLCHSAFVFRYIRGFNESESQACAVVSAAQAAESKNGSTLEAMAQTFSHIDFLVRKGVSP